MMDKRIFFIIILLLSCLTVSAEEVIYGEWISDLTNISLDEGRFEIHLGNDGKDLLILSDDIYESVAEGECIIESQIKFCFNFSKYDIEEQEYFAYLEISKILPGLDLERTVDDNILDVGDESNFVAVLTNTGDDVARDIVFMEDFPEQIEILSTKGCREEENKVIWEGDLKPGKTQECTYKVVVRDSLDQNLVASAKYYDGFSDQEVFSDSVRIYASPIIDILLTVEKDELQVGEKATIEINITNNLDEDITINGLAVTIPSGLAVESSDLDLIDGIYFWDGDIDALVTKSFDVEVSGKMVRKSVILADLEYEYDNDLFSKKNTKISIETVDEGIELVCSLENNQKLESNEKAYFYISIENKNVESPIKDIVLNTSTDLLHIPLQYISDIAENTTSVAYRTEIFFPELNSTTKYNLDFNVSYKTAFGDAFSYAKEIVVYVEPIRKLVIKKTISPSKIGQDEYAIVNVDIKNERNIDINKVVVSESIPDEFTTEGITSSVISLETGETKNAYSYKIKGPYMVNETYFEINTTASYSDDDKDYSFLSIKGLTATTKKLKIDVKKSVSNTEPHVGEIVDVSYVIENKESVPAYGLVLETTRNTYADTLNLFRYEIDHLDPGERIILNSDSLNEQIRPKVEGKIVLDGSILHYEDKNGILHNCTSSSVTLDVKENYLDGPAIILTKAIDNPILDKGETAQISIVVKNIGDESCPITLSDGIYNWNLTVDVNSNKTIEYDFIYDEISDINFDQAQATYNYKNNMYVAYSNIISVRESQGQSDVGSIETDSPEDALVSDESGSVEPIVKKDSLFNRLLSWFKGLFR